MNRKLLLLSIIYTLQLYTSIRIFGQTGRTVQLDLSRPPTSAKIFAPGIISTSLYERDMAISPDGNELFFTIVSPQNIFSAIIYMVRDPKGNWSKPEVASFSGEYSDLEPAFSPDGKKLFFVSNRPLVGDSIKDFDIWYVEKFNGKWGHPINLGDPVNTEANEFYPSIAKNGNLYFTAEYERGKGKEDVYVAKWEHGKYSVPESLDSAVNSPMYDFNAYVSPDEEFIIFTSYGRSDDNGRGDLYISKKDKNGKWQPARNITFINSPRLDYCPFVSFDKKIMFFSSERSDLKGKFSGHPATYQTLVNQRYSILNGQSNIYWIDFSKILQMFR